jgi:hypothetical protein
MQVVEWWQICMHIYASLKSLYTNLRVLGVTMLNGTKWKGSRLRIEKAKPDITARCVCMWCVYRKVDLTERMIDWKLNVKLKQS